MAQPRQVEVGLNMITALIIRNKGTDTRNKGSDTRNKGSNTRNKGTDTRNKGTDNRTKGTDCFYAIARLVAPRQVELGLNMTLRSGSEWERVGALLGESDEARERWRER